MEIEHDGENEVYRHDEVSLLLLHRLLGVSLMVVMLKDMEEVESLGFTKLRLEVIPIVYLNHSLRPVLGR